MATRKQAAKRPSGSGARQAATRLTAAETRALRTLLDKAAIRDVIDLYYHSIDAHNLKGLNSVFTADARIDFSGGLVKYVGAGGMIKGIQTILKSGAISSSSNLRASLIFKPSSD